MKIRKLAIALVWLGTVTGNVAVAQDTTKQDSAALTLPAEKHLKNVRQLTFGGQNAEAYFSIDDKTLIFQHQGEGFPATRFTPCRWTLPMASRQCRNW